MPSNETKCTCIPSCAGGAAWLFDFCILCCPRRHAAAVGGGREPQLEHGLCEELGCCECQNHAAAHAGALRIQRLIGALRLTRYAGVHVWRMHVHTALTQASVWPKTGGFHVAQASALQPALQPPARQSPRHTSGMLLMRRYTICKFCVSGLVRLPSTSAQCRSARFVTTSVLLGILAFMIHGNAASAPVPGAPHPPKQRPHQLCTCQPGVKGRTSRVGRAGRNTSAKQACAAGQIRPRVHHPPAGRPGARASPRRRRPTHAGCRARAPCPQWPPGAPAARGLQALNRVCSTTTGEQP